MHGPSRARHAPHHTPSHHSLAPTCSMAASFSSSSITFFCNRTTDVLPETAGSQQEGHQDPLSRTPPATCTNRETALCPAFTLTTSSPAVPSPMAPPRPQAPHLPRTLLRTWNSHLPGHAGIRVWRHAWRTDRYHSLLQQLQTYLLPCLHEKTPVPFLVLVERSRTLL